MLSGLRTYPVSAAARRPLINFMLNALKDRGCRIIHISSPDRAPFVFTFELSSGERMGVVAYAFLATRTPTKNRPKDERSFQVKYGSKESYAAANLHRVWRDPLGLFTTLFIGISPSEGYFVSADPAMHDPTKFFIRIEFKDEQVEEIAKEKWFAWERDRRLLDEPIEVMVGATAEHFLELIRFERAAEGLDQGNRQLLAESPAFFSAAPPGASSVPDAAEIFPASVHPLAEELALSPDEILDLIASARRLKMAVRGWVAEEHLKTELSRIPDVTECERLDKEGGADVSLRYRGGRPLLVECKNSLRKTDRLGNPRLDFQRTRTSKGDPCSRYYAPTDFDVVAACLHAVTQEWEFRYVLPGALREHGRCEGKITNNIIVDGLWASDPSPVFQAAGGAQ